jgi:hypothetical protein
VKRFEIGRNTAPFRTFAEWLASEVPECKKWLSTVSALVITRNLLGDTVRLVAPSDGIEWGRVSAAIMDGLESQCGVRPFDVEVADTL